MLGVMELELSLRGSVEMSSSTWTVLFFWRALWPFYVLARLVTFYVYFDGCACDGSDCWFFGGVVVVDGVFVTSSVVVLAAAGDVLTKQQQHQT
jgi:hypothetical protein